MRKPVLAALYTALSVAMLFAAFVVGRATAPSVNTTASPAGSASEAAVLPPTYLRAVPSVKDVREEMGRGDMWVWASVDTALNFYEDPSCFSAFGMGQAPPYVYTKPEYARTDVFVGKDFKNQLAYAPFVKISVYQYKSKSDAESEIENVRNDASRKCQSDSVSSVYNGSATLFLTDSQQPTVPTLITACTTTIRHYPAPSNWLKATSLSATLTQLLYETT